MRVFVRQSRSMRVLVLVVSLLAVFPAYAQDCPVPEGVAASAIARRPAAERLEFLRKAISEESRKGTRWRNVWGSVYAGMTMAQLIAVPIAAEPDRVDWWVGAATSMIGVTFSLMDPLKSVTDGPGFVAQAEKPGDTCALIAEGERILFADATKERISTSWFMHVGNILLNTGVALVLGLGWKHWVTGAINGSVGAAIGEATMFTAPTGAIDAARAYREGGQPQASLEWMLAPYTLRGGGGVSFVLRF